jgi:hypothetical protein
MRRAVYNSAIPDNCLKSVTHATLNVRAMWLAVLFFLVLMVGLTAQAADWSAPEQQLARKIAAFTGPGTVALTIENRSSLGRRDSEVVQNGLRTALEQAGIHFVEPEQSVASVAITLSENVTSYVWVAQIHQSTAESTVVIVSLPRSGGVSPAHDSMPITLRKTMLWSQSDPILDVAILEENGAQSRIAVLSAGNVSLYRLQSGKGQAEQSLPITHARPWPLDLRGRLASAKDHLLDAYLPGVICRTSAGGTLVMNCRESDDPWPMVPAAMVGSATVFPTAGSSSGPSVSISQVAAFFAPNRNFFTGVLTPAVGKFSTVPKFYSAAFVPRDRYTLWLFTAPDGKVHMLDGMSDHAARLEWNSDIASVRTACGAGWQVLAASSGDQSGSSLRAYEFLDRDPVAVSPALDLPGEISALWTEQKGDSAVAIVNNRETGDYEAYRLAVSCGQ